MSFGSKMSCRAVNIALINKLSSHKQAKVPRANIRGM